LYIIESKIEIIPVRIPRTKYPAVETSIRYTGKSGMMMEDKNTSRSDRNENTRLLSSFSRINKGN